MADEAKYLSPEEALSEPSNLPRPYSRVITKDFQAKSGVQVRLQSSLRCSIRYKILNNLIPLQIGKDTYLGRMLGAGVQAKVFDVCYEDGSSTGKVIKLAHSNLGRKVFFDTMASSMMNMQFEWELGLIVKGALEQDGTLPGFTKTMECVALVEDENKRLLTFQGFMMERMNGYPISKRVNDPGFHNIHFVREMLHQVLSSLDRAQRALGFNHADMGLGNVMEHYPVTYPEIERKNREANLKAMGKPVPEEKSVEPAAGDPFSGSDNGLPPLGPAVEFKLIDYGIGQLDEVLAQAAGGRTPKETIEFIQKVIVKRLKMTDSNPLAEEDLENQPYTLLPHATVKTGPGQARAWTFIQVGKAENNEYLCEPDSEILTSTTALEQAFPQKGAVEKMYRGFWERKGDLFHLILALAMALDDRVWPKDDEKDVQLFASLVHHVTGVKLRAYFVTGAEEKQIKMLGKTHRGKKGHKSDHEDVPESYYGRRARMFGKLRRIFMLRQAHMHPFNSGLLAGEALMSPFFRGKPPAYAAPILAVEKIFPADQSDEA